MVSGVQTAAEGRNIDSMTHHNSDMCRMGCWIFDVTRWQDKCSRYVKIFLVIRQTERISWNVSFIVGGLLFLPLFLHNNFIYCQLLLMSLLININRRCTLCKILKWMQNGRVLYLLHYICKQYKIQIKLKMVDRI